MTPEHDYGGSFEPDALCDTYDRCASAGHCAGSSCHTQPMTHKHDDGGPAFPAFNGNMSVREDGTIAPIYEGGMSLRDWFAGQALAGLSADDHTYAGTKEDTAEWAYAFADAMLAQRAKREGV